MAIPKKITMNKNWIIAGLAIALALVILFTCNGRKVPKPETIPTKTQVEDVKKVEAKIQPDIDSLNYELEILKSDNYNINIDLKMAQEKNRQLAAKAKVIHDTIPVPIHDNEYYSKQQIIDELITGAEVSDSICNESIENLNAQITDYKHADSLKNQLYFSLRQSFDKSIEQQNILQGYSKKLETKIRWTKAGKFLWKGAAIVGGLFFLKTVLK